VAMEVGVAEADFVEDAVEDALVEDAPAEELVEEDVLVEGEDGPGGVFAEDALAEVDALKLAEVAFVADAAEAGRVGGEAWQWRRRVEVAGHCHVNG